MFAWVNDEDSKRAYESADDAYRVFRRRLDSGRPPSDWGQLLSEARAESERLGRIASGERTHKSLIFRLAGPRGSQHRMG